MAPHKLQPACMMPCISLEINQMKSNGKFRPGVSGNPAARWKPGQSGNPAGKSRRRNEFEEAFNEALLTGGGPEEAAKLLWEAARGKEPWAIQSLPTVCTTNTIPTTGS